MERGRTHTRVSCRYPGFGVLGPNWSHETSRRIPSAHVRIQHSYGSLVMVGRKIPYNGGLCRLERIPFGLHTSEPDAPAREDGCRPHWRDSKLYLAFAPTGPN